MTITVSTASGANVTVATVDSVDIVAGALVLYASGGALKAAFASGQWRYLTVA